MKFPSFSSMSYTAIPLTLFLALLLLFGRTSNFDLFQTLSSRTATNDSLPGQSLLNSGRDVLKPGPNSGSVNRTTDTVQNVTGLIPDSGLENGSASQGSVNTTADLEFGRAQNDSAMHLKLGSENGSASGDPISRIDKPDPLLGGLLSAGFDEMSCQSRYQTHLLRRKPSPHQPSKNLISKLRRYERLHKRCGPGSRIFRKLAKSSPNRIVDTKTCKYISWIPVNGLGNMIISLTATFLYALLTDRVLLVKFGPGMDGLFCEPFPNSSWISPQHFPHRNQEASLPNFDTLLNSNNSSPKFLYLDIERKHDKPFHCDYGQELLQKVPVVFIRSDQYFVPSLFIVEKFNPELIRMFPDKGTVFHHLGRYLFHPSNQAWGLITRFFDTYLANADQRIGIQIRVFNSNDVPPQTVMDQITTCSKTYNILPELSQNRTPSVMNRRPNGAVKAILVASLSAKYADDLRTRYWTAATAAEGEKVGVFQASHEGVQKFEDEMHNVKAWAEMYMLSLCDSLVTSGQSTFGYVGQGLGDVKPWILQKPLDKNIPAPPCWRGLSAEPCFHFPPEYECARRSGGRGRWNVSSSFGYLKPCEDLNSGVKLMP